MTICVGGLGGWFSVKESIAAYAQTHTPLFPLCNQRQGSCRACLSLCHYVSYVCACVHTCTLMRATRSIGLYSVRPHHRNTPGPDAVCGGDAPPLHTRSPPGPIWTLSLSLTFGLCDTNADLFSARAAAAAFVACVTYVHRMLCVLNKCVRCVCTRGVFIVCERVGSEKFIKTSN